MSLSTAEADVALENAEQRKRSKLIQVGLDIEEKSAKQAKSIGFYPSRLILTHLPIREPNKNYYTISNGRWVLEINGSSFGIPYGVYARIDLARMVTLAVKNLFLTYRFNAIRNDKHIPWVSLKNQFGDNYANTAEALRNFKKQLITALKSVLVVYPDANIAIDEGGLWLKRSKQHV